MIIIHVMGGLGNQLYQYALYEKLKSLGKQVKLDLYAYKEAAGEDRERRALELEWLDGMQYEVCTADERRLFLDNSMRFADRVRRKLTGRRDKTVMENADYMPEIFEMDDVYLYGFWGCERYYIDIIPLLQEKIRFPKNADPRNQELLETMEHVNAVGIHIRRKDYLTVADGKRYMGICTDAYYASAVDYISERVENPVFYIFSDDAAYAKAHYNQENMRVVDWNVGRESLHDMELMSRCRHNICANSTFSIWGARLNRNPGRIAVRPLHHDNYEVSDAQTVHENWPGWTLIDPAGHVAY
ncbi:MAG: alpha-1,2-fucosyltransferase [Lachnospiraceae bacterium]|nr:alpha-1,2-fucosyltransferase [Lachnospiraceae bacterium]